MKQSLYYLIGVVLCCSVSVARAGCPVFDGRIFLNSVEYNQAGAPVAAIFGYELNSNAPITLSAGGPCNFFLPTNFRKGLIGTFEPGLHERAFRVEMPATETIFFWFLSDHSAGVDLKTARPSTLFGMQPDLPPAVVARPYSQQLLANGGKGVLTWSALALPAGFTLSSDGKLSGTPSKAGQFAVRVQVSEGETTVASAYLLTIVDTLTIDDVASTRASGSALQLRLVSTATNSTNAATQCDATEYVVSGGGTCTVPNHTVLRGVLSSSQPTANGWAVKCGLGAATAVAVCGLR